MQHRISLNKANLNFSRVAYEKLGKPERVDIYYDVKNKAIKIVPNKVGRKINAKTPNSRVMSSTLSRIMPIGKYEHERDNIFVLVA
jgi:hypothetical protein